MNRDYFEKLFGYDYWANERVLKALEAMPSPAEETIKKISHVLLGKEMWLSRLTPVVAALDMTRVLSVAECLILNREIREKADGYLSKLTEAQLSGKVAYKNHKGVPLEAILTDILTQVITHGTYHRGQIASLIKKSGGTPPATDFITYVRE